VRWYVNDVSLQGQFPERLIFECLLREIMSARARIDALRRDLHTTRSFPERFVTAGNTLREMLRTSRDRDLRASVFIWLDRTGPYVEDDRQSEENDYFEHADLDITESGLGEAARRVKAGEQVSTFSFEGGEIEFARSPLLVDHGLAEARLGNYSIDNVWTVNDLERIAVQARPPVSSWRMLIETARQRFPRLIIPNSIYEHPALAREPFEAVIRDRVLALLGFLDAYMAGRGPDGSEGAESRSIVDRFFVGERALFSGESNSNQRDFRVALTFPDPEDPALVIFAHWHGKISHRFFRMHFEWPVPAKAEKLKVVYLGPKLTKG
jgi:hypothetical protein